MRYTMDDKQVEALASERTRCAGVVSGFDGVYLKALVAGTQARLVKAGKRPETVTQLAALDLVAVPFYAAVLRGVVTDEIALGADLEAAEAQRRTRERNRRATFARSAKSTLVAWVKAGGDVRALAAATVGKSELRIATVKAQAAREPAGAQIERAQRAILAAAAREGPEEARAYLGAAIEALQDALDRLPGKKPGDGMLRARVIPARMAA